MLQRGKRVVTKECSGGASVVVKEGGGNGEGNDRGGKCWRRMVVVDIVVEKSGDVWW